MLKLILCLMVISPMAALADSKCEQARKQDGDGAYWGDATCEDGTNYEMINTREEAVHACADHGGLQSFDPPACGRDD